MKTKQTKEITLCVAMTDSHVSHWRGFLNGNMYSGGVMGITNLFFARKLNPIYS